MKEKLVFFLLIVLNFSLNSQEIYDNFYKFKAELYNTPSEKTAAAIDEYGNKIEKMQISEEEKLTLQNFLVLEEINLLNRDKNNKKKIYLMLKKQNEESAAFMQGKKNSKADKWFLLSWADIKSRYIAFLSGQDIQKEANDTKMLYLAALKKDKKFAPASISFGLWLFFAPPIVTSPRRGLPPFMTNTSFILNLKFFRLALNFSTKKAPNHRAFLDYKA